MLLRFPTDVASSWHYHAIRARKQRTVQYEAAHCVADHREHVTCTCASQLVYEPASYKYNSLPSKSQGAKIVVGRYGRNGKAIEQRLDQQRRAEAAAAARGAAHAAE